MKVTCMVLHERKKRWNLFFLYAQKHCMSFYLKKQRGMGHGKATAWTPDRRGEGRKRGKKRGGMEKGKGRPWRPGSPPSSGTWLWCAVWSGPWWWTGDICVCVCWGGRRDRSGHRRRRRFLYAIGGTTEGSKAVPFLLVISFLFVILKLLL